jgi:hypothetical protein
MFDRHVSDVAHNDPKAAGRRRRIRRAFVGALLTLSLVGAATASFANRHVDKSEQSELCSYFSNRCPWRPK